MFFTATEETARFRREYQSDGRTPQADTMEVRTRTISGIAILGSQSLGLGSSGSGVSPSAAHHLRALGAAHAPAASHEMIASTAQGAGIPSSTTLALPQSRAEDLWSQLQGQNSASAAGTLAILRGTRRGAMARAMAAGPTLEDFRKPRYSREERRAVALDMLFPLVVSSLGGPAVEHDQLVPPTPHLDERITQYLGAICNLSDSMINAILVATPDAASLMLHRMPTLRVDPGTDERYLTADAPYPPGKGGPVAPWTREQQHQQRAIADVRGEGPWAPMMSAQRAAEDAARQAALEAPQGLRRTRPGEATAPPSSKAARRPYTGGEGPLAAPPGSDFPVCDVCGQQHDWGMCPHGGKPGSKGNQREGREDPGSSASDIPPWKRPSQSEKGWAKGRGKGKGSSSSSSGGKGSGWGSSGWGASGWSGAAWWSTFGQTWKGSRGEEPTLLVPATDSTPLVETVAYDLLLHAGYILLGMLLAMIILAAFKSRVFSRFAHGARSLVGLLYRLVAWFFIEMISEVGARTAMIAIDRYPVETDRILASLGYFRRDPADFVTPLAPETADASVDACLREEFRPLWVSNVQSQTDRPSVSNAAVQAKAAPPAPPSFHSALGRGGTHLPGLPNRWGRVWRTTSGRGRCWHASPSCSQLMFSGTPRPCESLAACRTCVQNANLVDNSSPLPSPWNASGSDLPEDD